MALITRTPMVDDDGSGETGTVLNNDWKQEFYNQIDALAASPGLDLWTVIDSTATGVVTDWTPGISGHTVIFWNGAADLTINSIAGGQPGQTITIRNNNGAGALIKLPHYVGGSVNSLINWAGSAPTPLAVNGIATYIFHPANGWRMTAHEQGAWITAPFNAAHYTPNTGTWTVTAGAVLSSRYRLTGRTIHFSFLINGTTVAGGPAYLAFQNGAFGGFLITAYITGKVGYIADVGSPRDGYITASPASAFLAVYKTDGTVFGAGGPTTHLQGQVQFEVN